MSLIIGSNYSHHNNDWREGGREGGREMGVEGREREGRGEKRGREGERGGERGEERVVERGRDGSGGVGEERSKEWRRGKKKAVGILISNQYLKCAQSQCHVHSHVHMRCTLYMYTCRTQKVHLGTTAKKINKDDKHRLIKTTNT